MRNHLLRSSSVVQQINYEPAAITHRTYDDDGTERFRLTARPQRVRAGSRDLAEQAAGTEAGWSWEPLDTGGVLHVRRVISGTSRYIHRFPTRP
ncbi:MAG: hypothetical protein ACREIA_09430 [Opitutaceae bacterium]